MSNFFEDMLLFAQYNSMSFVMSFCPFIDLNVLILMNIINITLFEVPWCSDIKSIKKFLNIFYHKKTKLDACEDFDDVCGLQVL